MGGIELERTLPVGAIAPESRNGNGNGSHLEVQPDTDESIFSVLQSIDSKLDGVVAELSSNRQELAAARQAEERKFGRRIKAAVAVIGFAALAAIGVITYAADRADNTIQHAEEAINSFSTKQFARDFARYGKVAACHEIQDLQKLLPKDIKRTCGFNDEKKKPATSATLTQE